jgi:hypothetical protein
MSVPISSSLSRWLNQKMNSQRIEEKEIARSLIK